MRSTVKDFVDGTVTSSGFILDCNIFHSPPPEPASELQWRVHPNLDTSATFFFVGICTLSVQLNYQENHQLRAEESRHFYCDKIDLYSCVYDHYIEPLLTKETAIMFHTLMVKQAAQHSARTGLDGRTVEILGEFSPWACWRAPPSASPQTSHSSNVPSELPERVVTDDGLSIIHSAPDKETRQRLTVRPAAETSSSGSFLCTCQRS